MGLPNLVSETVCWQGTCWQKTWKMDLLRDCNRVLENYNLPLKAMLLLSLSLIWDGYRAAKTSKKFLCFELVFIPTKLSILSEKEQLNYKILIYDNDLIVLIYNFQWLCNIISLPLQNWNVVLNN